MKRYKEEGICRELGNKESLTSSLVNQSLCLTASCKFQAGLQISEEAYKIASDCGYTELAEQIETILQGIRDKVK